MMILGGQSSGFLAGFLSAVALSPHDNAAPAPPGFGVEGLRVCKWV